MFGEMFGDTAAREAINAQRIHQAAISTAILTLLVKKGIFTEEEFSRELVCCQARVDQLAAEQSEQAAREFDEKNPGLRKMIGKLTGSDA